MKDLIKDKFDIKVILTKSGKKFLTPLSLSSLINKEVHTDIFSKKGSTDIWNILTYQEKFRFNSCMSS